MLSIFEEAAQKSYSFPCVIIVLLDKLTQLFAGQLPYKLILLRYFTEDDEGSSDQMLVPRICSVLGQFHENIFSSLNFVDCCCKFMKIVSGRLGGVGPQLEMEKEF